MEKELNIIVNSSSMIPIYEQIVNQIKAGIVSGRLTAETALPSVRTMAKDLKISALTVKKAYDSLEEEGFVVTVHGKGTFVAASNQELIREEQTREIEKRFEETIIKARQCGLNDEEIRDIFEILMEGQR